MRKYSFSVISFLVSSCFIIASCILYFNKSTFKKHSLFNKKLFGRLLATTSREFHPCSIKAALPIACDAFNARTVAVKEYQYYVYTSLPSNCQFELRRKCLSLFPHWRGRRAPAAWLGINGMYPNCCLCCGELSAAAFFVKYDRFFNQ